MWDATIQAAGLKPQAVSNTPIRGNKELNLITYEPATKK
jgi:hypothetical protein